MSNDNGRLEQLTIAWAIRGLRKVVLIIEEGIALGVKLDESMKDDLYWVTRSLIKITTGKDSPKIG